MVNDRERNRLFETAVLLAGLTALAMLLYSVFG
jgi:hypothetical protein